MRSKAISKTDFNKNQNVLRVTFLPETIPHLNAERGGDPPPPYIAVSTQSIKSTFNMTYYAFFFFKNPHQRTFFPHCLRERERESKRAGERETSMWEGMLIGCLFVDTLTGDRTQNLAGGPDQEWNPWTLSPWDKAPTDWATSTWAVACHAF